MRKYKPYRSVVESLKKSTFLDVVDDKYLQRKIPLEESLIVAAKSTKQAGDEVVQKPAKEQESAANRAPAVKATPLPAWTTKAMVSFLISSSLTRTDSSCRRSRQGSKNTGQTLP